MLYRAAHGIHNVIVLADWREGTKFVYELLVPVAAYHNELADLATRLHWPRSDHFVPRDFNRHKGMRY